MAPEYPSEGDEDHFPPLCRDTYQPLKHRPWFLFCSLPYEPRHTRHAAHDAGGNWLMGWDEPVAVDNSP